MSGNAPHLRVTVSRLSSYALVSVTGAIEYGSHEILADHLTRTVDLIDTAMIIDLSGVDFCDSSGLSVFAAAARHARTRRLTLVACGLTERVHRVFTITRLDQAIYLKCDLDTAINWLENGTSASAPGPDLAPPNPAPDSDPV